MTPLFDPGLQPERTHLAWRRTALSLGVGSLVAARLLPVVLGQAAWALVGMTGFLVAVGLWVAAWRRHRAVIRALAVSGEAAQLPGAAILALLASIVVVGGAAGLTVVVVDALG